ncbi:MAG: BamA/TamA family outer membrane protein [Candidatus Eiseniibacteriota bacterium]
MSQTPSLRLLAGLGLLLGPLLADAHGFGRNKVQYDTFDWRVLETEHLEIHYYPEEEALARRAADYGEDACRKLDAALGHKLSKKIPLIVYGSHYHFRQNNVTRSLVGESTGGFTEIFRTRVALPYAGSESEFRHVVHHELVHAYVFDRLYGGPIRSLFVLQYAFYVPLWFQEGIAEYYSNCWDSESEMMLRDAAISGALPPFDQVHGGYFVYKAGWSAVGWLADRHGDDVVRRILESLEENRDLRAAIREVTGEEPTKLAQEWLLDVRRHAWPSFAHLDSPERAGRLLTSHVGGDGALNANAVLSPSGKRAAFLSNRSGTPDLWVMDVDSPAEPRVLVRGARGGKFESLHPLRSSVGWSPDERLLVCAAQKGARDALYVLDAGTGRTVAEFVPDLDALERPDWSSADARFVFTGMKSGQVDLWTMEADGTRLARLTDDLAREEAPRFSPDGRRVVYASDAADSTGLDLWILDLARGEARPLRVAEGDQWDPCWSADGTRIFHVSDENGTRDLVSCSIEGDDVRRLTALVGGADSPTAARESGRLVFTAYHEGGWDLVLVEDADTLRAEDAPAVELPEIPWAGHTVRDSVAVASVPADSLGVVAAQPAEAESLAVVAAGEAEAESRGVAPPTEAPYRLRFRSEWITGAFLYDGFGPSAQVASSISDVLGNHRFQIGANLFRSMANADAFLTYSYLPGRLDWTVGMFHLRDQILDDRTSLGQPLGEEGDEAFFSERRWGLLANASYPFHTFRRVGLEVTALEMEREVSAADASASVRNFRGRVVIPRLHHSFDNTLWGWTGPVQGRRSLLSVEHSVPVGGEPLSFGTVIADARWYGRFGGEYVAALRTFAASSFGADPQEFQIGGPSSIRGYPRQVFHGRHAALVSAEFRYPFLEYVKLGWPFRSAFGGVRGDLFVDAGTAVGDPASFHGARRDLHVGFGVGARARLAYLPFRVDVGWPTDFGSVGEPVWHVTIAPEF